MSSKDLAVSVRGLSKSYTIAHSGERHSTASEALLHRLKSPFSRGRGSTETFWALRDVSFDIQKGEVVGIIGRNGAGKSTLLKILSQITEPSAGEIRLFGQVGSLLEVGTGFHPELTGRENIFLNGAILGMRRRDIERQFDQIVDFAEVEQFLDTPVKRYSSGMYVRLAFAVAAHLNPEILIVDEVLAVGDATFQKKCLGKMQDVAEHEGRTVLFVSHNMSAVRNLCKRVVLLKGGALGFEGNTEEALQQYLEEPQETSLETSPGEFDLTQRSNKHLPDALVARRLKLLDSRGRAANTFLMGHEMSIVISVEGLSKYKDSDVGVGIKSSSGEYIGTLSTSMREPLIRQPRQDREQVTITLPRLPFTPGTYSVDVGIAQQNIRMLDFVEQAASFHIEEFDIYGNGFQVHRTHGMVFLDGETQISGEAESTGSEPAAAALPLAAEAAAA